MDREILNVKEVKEILGIGINQAYKLVASKGFPKIILGRRYLIPRDEFYQWIRKYTYREYHI